MENYKGKAYLKQKLNTKRTRVLMRYQYYDMKNYVRDFQISTPPKLRDWTAVLGWCGKAVDSIADRVVFREFGNDNFDINQIFSMNNPDIFFDSAVLSALISSCCFIYISPDANGFPRLQVIDGANATGIIDPITGLLVEGYAVLERNEFGTPTVEAHFKKGSTVFYKKGESKPQELFSKIQYPLLVPIIYKPDAVRVFGRSRIKRSCMNIMSSAIRTMKRSEIAAEFFSFPQRYVLGTDPDMEAIDKWRASMSALLEMTKDEDGDVPTVGQFQQQSMAPHTEHLKMFAALFAGETGLTLDDLGFATGNPASADAIKASHDNLRLTARRAQRNFSSGLLNVGYLSACLRDDFAYKREQFYLTKAQWEPLFEPDAAMLSSIGDGAIKINQAVPGYIGNRNLRDLTGIKPETE